MKMSEESSQYLSPSTVPEAQKILSRESYGQVVADIGAGNLPFTEYIYNNIDDSVDILAIDLPGRLNTHLKSENIYYIEGNAADPLQPGEIDTIYAVNVIQDTKNPGNFLDSLERARSPSGVIVLSFPDERNIRPWPENSIFEDKETGLDKFSVSMSKEPGNYEQFFIPLEWIKNKSERLGLKILESGRVPININAMEEIAERAEDPSELPSMKKLPEGRDPSVRYCVLG